jgi:hypothetical protein
MAGFVVFLVGMGKVEISLCANTSFFVRMASFVVFLLAAGWLARLKFQAIPRVK